VAKTPSGTSGAKRWLLLLARRSSDDGKPVRSRQTRQVADIGRSERSVRRYLVEAERLGLCRTGPEGRGNRGPRAQLGTRATSQSWYKAPNVESDSRGVAGNVQCLVRPDQYVFIPSARGVVGHPCPTAPTGPIPGPAGVVVAGGERTERLSSRSPLSVPAAFPTVSVAEQHSPVGDQNGVFSGWPNRGRIRNLYRCRWDW
jgi:hypothetical protein